MYKNAERGWSSELYFPNAPSPEEIVHCLKTMKFNRWLGCDSIVTSIASPLQVIITLFVVLFVEWRALRRFDRTLISSAHPSRLHRHLHRELFAHPRLAEWRYRDTLVEHTRGQAVRTAELARVSRAHGGRRYGQTGGHGYGLWLRPHHRQHPGHQSWDHRVMQVSSCCCGSASKTLGRSVRFGCIDDMQRLK